MAVEGQPRSRPYAVLVFSIIILARAYISLPFTAMPSLLCFTAMMDHCYYWNAKDLADNTRKPCLRNEVVWECAKEALVESSVIARQTNTVEAWRRHELHLQ